MRKLKLLVYIHLLQQLLGQKRLELGDYYLALNVLQRVRNGKEQTYSAADVRAELGMDN